MRTSILIGLLLVGGIKVWASENPSDGRVPRFAICPDNIKSVLVVKDETTDRETWRLAITLNDTGAQQLKVFSETHLGDVTELVFDGAVLIRERFRDVVGSGKILTGQWQSGTAATEVMMLIGNSSLGVPCGIVAF